MFHVDYHYVPRDPLGALLNPLPPILALTGEYSIADIHRRAAAARRPRHGRRAASVGRLPCRGSGTSGGTGRPAP